MKRIFLTAAAIAATATSQAVAQQAHGSLGVIVDEGFEDFGAVGRVGYDFSSYFGIEGELNYFALDDDDVNLGPGVDVDADVFGYLAFAKAQAPVGERLSVFGRVGYGGITIDVDVDVDGVGSESASESEDAFAYGVGAEYAFTPTGAVRADYTRLDLGDGVGDQGFFALSYTLRFGGAR